MGFTYEQLIFKSTPFFCHICTFFSCPKVVKSATIPLLKVQFFKHPFSLYSKYTEFQTHLQRNYQKVTFLMFEVLLGINFMYSCYKISYQVVLCSKFNITDLSVLSGSSLLLQYYTTLSFVLNTKNY